MSEQITLTEEIEKHLELFVAVYTKTGGIAGGILKKCGVEGACFEQIKPEMNNGIPTGRNLLVKSCIPYESMLYFECIANKEENSFT